MVLRTTQENVSIPLTNPTQLWASRVFNPNLPLVIFVTGWKTNLLTERSEAQDTLANAYLCRGNVNFVVSFFLEKHLVKHNSAEMFII